MGWLARIGIGLALVAGTVTALGAVLLGQIHDPADREPEQARCAADAPLLPRGTPVKVLVWNVQYAGSRKHHFFYDGGEAVHVPEQDVRDTLASLVRVVQAADPDIILWQELDRASDRTHRIDEHAELLAALNYPCDVSTPYHRAPYVPHPPQQHLGAVDMHLSVFSRYQISSATRIALPLLNEPWWRQAMNLKRALLDVRLPMDDGTSFQLMTTHLSAFSNRDGTLDRQMAVLDEAATEAELAGRPWLLGGDFNALPPGDDPSRLPPKDAALYELERTPIQRLFDRFPSAVSATQYLADPARWRTYLPFGATEPDRAIDYVFHARTVRVQNMQVLPELEPSDHLPILLELVVE